jgi:hypothetical protein
MGPRGTARTSRGSSPAVRCVVASAGEDEAGAVGGLPGQRPSGLLAGWHLAVPASWKGGPGSAGRSGAWFPARLGCGPWIVLPNASTTVRAAAGSRRAVATSGTEDSRSSELVASVTARARACWSGSSATSRSRVAASPGEGDLGTPPRRQEPVLVGDDEPTLGGLHVQPLQHLGDLQHLLRPPRPSRGLRSVLTAAGSTIIRPWW